MARFLLAATPAAGHVNPGLPIVAYAAHARELADRAPAADAPERAAELLATLAATGHPGPGAAG